MKRILLVIVLIIGILSCGMPKEVEYPNENLKIENNMVLYKNKKYTGKISIEDEGKNVTGEINLKDGKLEGGGFYKIGDVYLLEYNIKEGKLDGKFAIKDTNDNFEMLSEYKDGKIRKFFTETELMITDFSFDEEGRVNGTEEAVSVGETIAFKDGFGERPDWGMEFKKYINKDGELVEETYKNGVLDDMYISRDKFYNSDEITKTIFGVLK